jgi:hypothetical protein
MIVFLNTTPFIALSAIDQLLDIQISNKGVYGIKVTIFEFYHRKKIVFHDEWIIKIYFTKQ